jgi:hypothetical protein
MTIIIPEPGYCEWQEIITVNTDTDGLQASRDSDCPWPIASDANGNVYTVWEDKRDTTQDDSLHIYFRKKNYNGSWEGSDDQVSRESNGELFGHPSICVLPGDFPPALLVCYVAEDYQRELRGNYFDGTEWEVASYYISDEDTIPGYNLPLTREGWGTNIAALSDGKAFAFWQYKVDSNITLYFNEYDNGWAPDSEKVVYSGDDSQTPHYSRHHNTCVDEDDNIHLSYSDYEAGDYSEIYYLSKSPQASNFGQYPGYQVSNASGDTSAIMPYCAISSYEDTAYLHVVWCTDTSGAGRIFYRNKNLGSGIWSSVIDTIAPTNETSYAPSIACDSYGDIHVAWQKEYTFNGSAVTKYRKFDAETEEWSSISTLPADTSAI